MQDTTRNDPDRRAQLLGVAFASLLLAAAFGCLILLPLAGV